MGLTRAATAKRDELINAALDAGTSPETIARDTGAHLATVYRKRVRWLHDRGDAAVDAIPDFPSVADLPIMAEIDRILFPGSVAPKVEGIPSLASLVAELKAVHRKLGKLIAAWDTKV